MASFLLVLFGLLLTGCGGKQTEVFEFSGATMGTQYHIKLLEHPKLDAEALQQQIDGLLIDFNQSLSTYIEDSEINQLNKAAVGESFAASDRLLAVHLLSRAIWNDSDGAFDPSVGPLIDLWGFGAPDTQNQIPSDEQIKASMALVGYDAIDYFPKERQLIKQKALQIDYSAIAKGAGVDEVALLLESQNIRNYMVEIGGEIRVKGLNERDEPWSIAIESPNLQSGQIQRVVQLRGKSIATSGDYRNYFEKDGVRYSHTIDPTSGRPITHKLASVTVISDTCAEADGWATAFMVLGTERAMEIAERNFIPVYILQRTESGYQVHMSTPFKAYLKQR